MRRKHCIFCNHKHIITKLYIVKSGKGTARDSSKMICMECPCFNEYLTHQLVIDKKEA